MNLTPETQQAMYEALKAARDKLCCSCAVGRPFEGGAHTFSSRVRTRCGALYERTLLARIDQELAGQKREEPKCES